MQSRGQRRFFFQQHRIVGVSMTSLEEETVLIVSVSMTSLEEETVLIETPVGSIPQVKLLLPLLHFLSHRYWRGCVLDSREDKDGMIINRSSMPFHNSKP